MKILIVSDTHGKNLHYLETIERVSPIDLMIHLGDYEGGEAYIKKITPCLVEMVSGNNDYLNGLPKDKIIHIGKYKILLTHGHRYGVNSTINNLIEAAQRNNVDIVMFGHTHVPMIDLRGSVWAINPGSLTLPRQHNKIPTFIIMDLDNEGNAHFALNYLKDID